ncbi:uncharacterized protein GGS22DRAFT_143952 [Annulohypoxylon maeteangense]|uniref:uncharacterized protein n=1 Tax=Annulohypoxylon maeteangense TaxID=1927788 RepID=UPI0020088E5C|nr:uncharacterized protein GGS22DRAFT_143952 [Annulohypoxylon maeteangense]KAI0884538.1 hypothetical protein GGS22DRAFT_143952 [Annulohypoxylon maeteangense]
MSITGGTGRVPENQQHDEAIPPYQSIAPSIFVPAQVDFTKPPPDLPSDHNQLRSEALAQIDEHADAVHDNIYYMLDREKTRIQQECERREAHFPRPIRDKRGLAEEEESCLPDNSTEMDEILFIRSLCPEPTRGPYEVPLGFSHANCLHVTTGAPGETPRKSAEKMVINLAKHGIQKLEGLSNHVKGVKEATSKDLANQALSKKLSSMGIAATDKMDIS